VDFARIRFPIERRHRTSLAALIAANVYPLVGVLALGWDLYSVMVLYWAENSIIGLYNVLKMLRIGGARAVPTVAFFCFHYGVFMFVHFVFVTKLFGTALFGFPGLHDVIVGLAPVADGLAAIFISHGISYYVNFLRGREYEGRTVEDQMNAPYQRMVVLHVTLIAGGWFVATLGAPIGALVVFVVIKTGMDAWAHLHERGRATPVGDSGPRP
jgi:hypothetical protein